MTVRELVMGHFHTQGEALLLAMFAAMAEDGQITDGEWDRLIAAARSLGLSENDLRKAVEPQAERFVEHVLADAKADERLSDDERRTLAWLLSKLSLSRPVTEYVQREIRGLELFTAISEGRLPSVAGTGVSLRSGEICHFHAPATYYQPRKRQNGSRYDEYQGTLAITDFRMLFDSPLKTLEVNHRKVVSLIPLQRGLELRSSGKGTGVYSLGQQDRLAIAIYRTAIGKANQTIVAKSEGLPTRHIPRDVRQRVWQRYGGRCAECSATHYLEFDHIVPVTKGGSNSDANVQLLCRGCNAKKADLI
jgi:hypothetical protein